MNGAIVYSRRDRRCGVVTRSSSVALSAAFSVTLGIVATLAPMPASAMTSGEPQGDYEVLGLSRITADLQDVQDAYVRLALEYHSDANVNDAAHEKFLNIHKSFEVLSNPSMQKEAASLVNYWAGITHLDGDEELHRFAQFISGGSAQLRLIFFVEHPNDRFFDIFTAALKLRNRVRVAQVCYSEALAEDGQPGEFLSTLKILPLPAVVLIDPISQGKKTMHSLEGVREEVERLRTMERLDGSERIALIQELDVQSFATRCGDGKCGWVVGIATSLFVERRRLDLTQALRSFVEACRTLHVDVSAHVACFWVRLDRAREWEVALKKHGMDASADIAYAAFRPESLSITATSAAVAGMNAEQISAWFKGVLSNFARDPVFPRLAQMPLLPLPLRLDEEPPEKLSSIAARKVRRTAKCALASRCREAAMEAAHNEWTEFKKSVDWEKLLTIIKNVDVESAVAHALHDTHSPTTRVLLVGTAVVALLCFFVLRKLCRRRRRVVLHSEEESLANTELLTTVTLRKSEGEKYGMGIDPHPSGGVAITEIYDDGLLARFNAAEKHSIWRVQKGDRIVCVIENINGHSTRITSSRKIIAALKGQEVIMRVALSCDQERGLQCLTGSLTLDGVVLEAVAELAPPQDSCGNDMVVVAISPQLAAWNAARRSERACCTQLLEVGDRVVSINGHVNVNERLGTESATLVVLKWRPTGSIRPEQAEVTLRKATPEDRWGMQIRQRVGAPKQMEILEIVEGALLSKWNDVNFQRPVRKGDRIIAVNGNQAIDKISEQLQAPGEIKILFERWIDIDDSSSKMSADLLNAARPRKETQQPKTELHAPNQTIASQPAKARSHKPWICATGFFMISTFGYNSGAGHAESKLEIQMSPSARSFMQRLHPDLYCDIALLLLFLGSLFTLHFFYYELSIMKCPYERQLVPQVFVALAASFLLGFGMFFLLAWAAVYV